MFNNPVKVIETNNWIEKYSNIQKKMGFTNPIIITTEGNVTRLKLLNFFDHNSIYSSIKPNPTFDTCQLAINSLSQSKYDSVVAIGGGSVMDTAKVVMAALGTRIYDINQLLKITTKLFNFSIPSIFIPTTHGTGSEVTMWGTVWDMKNKKKYSISHPSLYPSVALLDSMVTTTLPLETSIITTIMPNLNIVTSTKPQSMIIVDLDMMSIRNIHNGLSTRYESQPVSSISI